MFGLQIVGMDARKIKNGQEEGAFVRTFFENVVLHPWMRNSRLVFMPEGNSGYAVDHIDMMLESMFHERLFTLRQPRDGRCGVVTSYYTKIHYAQRAKNVMINGNVQFILNWVFSVVDNARISDVQRRGEILKEFYEQLRRFRQTTKEIKNPYEIPKTTFSGKTNERGIIVPSLNDDLFDTFAMCVSLIPNLISGMMAHLTPEQYKALYRSSADYD